MDLMSKYRFIEKPKVLLLYSNMVGEQVKLHLLEMNERLIGDFKPDILDDEQLLKYVQINRPDLIITCYWPYLLSKDIFSIPRYGCINFHPSLLPRNRGWYPAVWSVLEGDKHDTGVTLHLVDEKADTGFILAQKRFRVKEEDTGGTVYGRSQLQMIELFKKTWKDLYNGGVDLVRQDNRKATYHKKKESNELDEIDINKKYKADDLLKLLRAKTFKDKSYTYYRKNGKKYFVSIKITEENGL